MMGIDIICIWWPMSGVALAKTEDLDVDIDVDALKNPQAYPLKFS